MNILILSWRGPNHPNAGGAEIVTFEHAKAWVRVGHKVTLFTSTFEGSKTNDENIEGVRIIRKGGQTFGVKLMAFIWYLFTKDEKYDLIVDEFHGIPFFTPLYIHKPILAFIHEVTKKEVWGMNPWPRPLNYIPKYIGPLFEPLIFKIFYKNVPFLTVSDSTAQELMEWGVRDKNISIIHNGVVLPNKLPKHASNRDVVISYLGALSKDKGVEDAIRVFASLHKAYPKWKFWIIGHGEKEYLAKLKMLSVDLGIHKCLKYWGYVDQKMKFELLSKTTILVNPSIREGWGLVVIEGASVGTPCVGYNVTGLKDSIRNGVTGVLCELSPEAMSQAVIKLYEDKRKYQKMITSAEKWSKNFSWTKSSNKSLNLIKKLAKNT
jgi:glycosyltransferase involved in cell wall biosynthesis